MVGIHCVDKEAYYALGNCEYNEREFAKINHTTDENIVIPLTKQNSTFRK